MYTKVVRTDVVVQHTLLFSSFSWLRPARLHLMISQVITERIVTIDTIGFSSTRMHAGVPKGNFPLSLLLAQLRDQDELIQVDHEP